MSPWCRFWGTDGPVAMECDRGAVLSKASELLGVSDRQVLRLWKRSQSGGAAGLKPGLRDRALNHPWDAACRERVWELYRAKYGDFGPTLAVEYLVKCAGEVLSEETLRQWLIGAGLWSARRRGAVPRQWRERRASWLRGTVRTTIGSRVVVAGRRGWCCSMTRRIGLTRSSSRARPRPQQ